MKVDNKCAPQQHQIKFSGNHNETFPAKPNRQTGLLANSPTTSGVVGEPDPVSHYHHGATSQLVGNEGPWLQLLLLQSCGCRGALPCWIFLNGLKPASSCLSSSFTVFITFSVNFHEWLKVLALLPCSFFRRGMTIVTVHSLRSKPVEPSSETRCSSWELIPVLDTTTTRVQLPGKTSVRAYIRCYILRETVVRRWSWCPVG